MRKVECTRVSRPLVDGKRVEEREVVEGVFHQWGSEYEEFEAGPGNYTVGLVEMPDGSIETFVPWQIKFITAA